MMARLRTASVDTSFWVHAGMVGGHDHLLDDFDLTVTTKVAEELGVYQASPSSYSGQTMKAALSDGKIRILDPSGTLIREFHAGEKAVLTLALEQQDELLPLVDEVKAYQWAVKQGLPVLSVPLWLATRAFKRHQDVPACIAKIRALVQGNRVSPLLAHEALILLGTV